MQEVNLAAGKGSVRGALGDSPKDGEEVTAWRQRKHKQGDVKQPEDSNG